MGGGPSSGVGDGVRRRRRREFAVGASSLLLLLVVVAAIAAGGVVAPPPCLASPHPSSYNPGAGAIAAATIVAPSAPMPRPPGEYRPRAALVSILDGLSRSGARGMAAYAIGFALWTMTVGVTTPVETAAGMAFPLRAAVPLSAFGKIGGASLQFALARYLFSERARRWAGGNKWMGRINASFRRRPFGSALVWRFSPLPEFVKNVGPALVPGLKTRHQLLAVLTHGLPFTALWSCMGNEAAIVARGVSPRLSRSISLSRARRVR